MGLGWRWVGEGDGLGRERVRGGRWVGGTADALCRV